MPSPFMSQRTAFSCASVAYLYQAVAVGVVVLGVVGRGRSSLRPVTPFTSSVPCAPPAPGTRSSSLVSPSMVTDGSSSAATARVFAPTTVMSGDRAVEVLRVLFQPEFLHDSSSPAVVICPVGRVGAHSQRMVWYRRRRHSPHPQRWNRSTPGAPRIERSARLGSRHVPRIPVPVVEVRRSRRPPSCRPASRWALPDCRRVWVVAVLSRASTSSVEATTVSCWAKPSWMAPWPDAASGGLHEAVVVGDVRRAGVARVPEVTNSSRKVSPSPRPEGTSGPSPGAPGPVSRAPPRPAPCPRSADW